MDKIYKFKQDDVVDFTSGELFGRGKVCGIASEGVAILGVTYIVEVIQVSYVMGASGPPIKMDYTHIPCFECNMSLAPREK